MAGYTTWEELVAAEANGWVAVIILTDGKQQWPWVTGPYATKREANNARNRLRTRFKRDQQEYHVNPTTTAKFFVRPSWKSTN